MRSFLLMHGMVCTVSLTMPGQIISFYITFHRTISFAAIHYTMFIRIIYLSLLYDASPDVQNCLFCNPPQDNSRNSQSDGIRPPPRYYSLSSCLVHPNLAQTCRGDIPGTVDTWICISARHPGIRIPENRFRRVF